MKNGKQKHGTSRVRVTTFRPVTENPAAEGDEYRPKIVPITHTPVDEDEALMRCEFILRAKKLRDELKELLDAEYLYSPNLSVDDTKRIIEHFNDARVSLETGICYVRPDAPKWEDQQ